MDMKMQAFLDKVKDMADKTGKVSRHAAGVAGKKANDLALAMEARCYHGGDGRTKMKPLKYKKRDAVAYLILFGYLGLVIGSGFLFK